MTTRKGRALPKLDSVGELIEFFDSHDMGSYWDAMPEAQFEVGIRRRKRLIAVDEELARRVAAVAEREHTTAEKLLESWLEERLSGVA